MQVHRAFTRRVSGGLVLLLQFMQLAVAAYACPAGLQALRADVAMAMPGCDGDMPRDRDGEQPQLCQARCQQGDQAVGGAAAGDWTPWPVLLAVIDWRPTAQPGLPSARHGPGAASEPSAAAAAHASHHPGTASAAAAPGMQERMQAMRAMHDKMMNAKTPAEREALMADHMKSMQGGMAMMKSMGCMSPMGAASGTGTGMSGGAMAQHPQAMEGCMQMMQMMMEMMSQRVPTAPASK